MPSRKVILKLPVRVHRPAAKFVDDDSDDSEISDSLGSKADPLSDDEEDLEDDEGDEMDVDPFDQDDGGDFEFDAEPSVEPARMTARQRSRVENEADTGRLDLPDLTEFDNPTSRKRKVLSAEEQRIKRAELARRRKNLSERRLEEEKQDTLDKLLKKRAGRPKKEDSEQSQRQMSRLVPAHPALRSWTSTANGLTYSFTETTS